MVVAWIEPHEQEDRSDADFIASVADGVPALAGQAGEYGFAANRLILVGSGAGAQTAALLATDEQLLPSRGVPLSSVRGMLSLDGTGFDLAEWRSRIVPRYE